MPNIATKLLKNMCTLDVSSYEDDLKVKYILLTIANKIK